MNILGRVALFTFAILGLAISVAAVIDQDPEFKRPARVLAFVLGMWAVAVGVAALIWWS